MAGKLRHPFCFCALVRKDDGPTRSIMGARGGIEWGETADEVRGILAARYLSGGFAIDILEVNPISDAGLAELGSYIAGRAALEAKEG